jgi:hypothetical protein
MQTVWLLLFADHTPKHYSLCLLYCSEIFQFVLRNCMTPNDCSDDIIPELVALMGYIKQHQGNISSDFRERVVVLPVLHVPK